MNMEKLTVSCKRCKGKGNIISMYATLGSLPIEHDCTDCEGKGYIINGLMQKKDDTWILDRINESYK